MCCMQSVSCLLYNSHFNLKINIKWDNSWSAFFLTCIFYCFIIVLSAHAFYLVAFSCLSADCWMFGLGCIFMISAKCSAQFQWIIRVDEHRKTFKSFRWVSVICFHKEKIFCEGTFCRMLFSPRCEIFPKQDELSFETVLQRWFQMK